MKKAFTIVLVLLAFCIRSNAQGLVINEVDYDQTGTDNAEFLELYNHSGVSINLGIYRVIFVNGSNSDSLYDSIPLPNQMLAAGAYFVICTAGGGTPICDIARPATAQGWIQNGPPDAIAIQDTVTGNLVDVLSYEGSCGPPYVEGVGVPVGASDDSAASPAYVGISRFPDGTDTNNDSADFHRACITPGSANNTNLSSACVNPLLVNSITKANLAIYPNPSNGFVNVVFASATKNTSFTVTNMLGNEVKKVNLKNSTLNYQLDLSDFQDGIYFVKIKSDADESIHRIMLKK